MNLFSQLSSPCTFCPERGELLVPDKGGEGSTSLVDRFGEC